VTRHCSTCSFSASPCSSSSRRFFLVTPAYAEYVLIGLGAFFVIVDLMVMAALRRPKA